MTRGEDKQNWGKPMTQPLAEAEPTPLGHTDALAAILPRGSPCDAEALKRASRLRRNRTASRYRPWAVARSAIRAQRKRRRSAMQRLVAPPMAAITIAVGAAVASICRLFNYYDARSERSGERSMPRRATTGLPALSRRTAGFTLLEVLIAFVIAALAIGAMVHAVGNGLASSRAAAHYQEAVSRARSHLDVAMHGTAVVPADTEGDDGGGFHWRMRVTPAASTTGQLPGFARRTAATVTLFAVSVTISWHDVHGTREVRLDSARVAESRP
jgi:general secretion pathway protein I